MTAAAHRTVRPPKQRRSRESYERVLDAAHGLLEQNGFEGFTVQEVAARSHVSVGAIYERFGNKEALLRTLHARLMDTVSEFDPGGTVVGLGGAGEVIDALVGRIAATMGAHRAILRAFMHLGAQDEVIADRGSLECVRLGQSFKEALRPYASELRHSDLEIALDVAFRITYSTLARQVMYGPLFESDMDLGWDQLVAELAIACRAYLLR